MALLAIISTVAACAATGVRCTADNSSAVIGLARGRDMPRDSTDHRFDRPGRTS